MNTTAARSEGESSPEPETRTSTAIKKDLLNEMLNDEESQINSPNSDRMNDDEMEMEEEDRRCETFEFPAKIHVYTSYVLISPKFSSLSTPKFVPKKLKLSKERH